jgi:hypothetical protein
MSSRFDVIHIIPSHILFFTNGSRYVSVNGALSMDITRVGQIGLFQAYAYLILDHPIFPIGRLRPESGVD